MSFIAYYLESVVRYDYISKFNVTNTKYFPQLIKIVLSFNCKTNSISNILSCALALELITAQKSKLTIKSSSKNINLKLKAGIVVGCNVILRRNTMLQFLAQINLFIAPRLLRGNLFIQQDHKYNNLSFSLKELFLYSSIKNNYLYFNTLPSLKILFVTNSHTLEDFLFILTSLKIPLIKIDKSYRGRNSIGRV